MLKPPIVSPWWNSVSRVSAKPAVLLSVSAIGCLMLWLASKQVKSSVQILVDLHLLGSAHAYLLLPEKPRYCLFGLLTLTFVWLDLVVLKTLMQSVVRVVTWSRKRLHAGEATEVLPKQKQPMKPVRKNPVRACRILSKRNMTF